MKSVKGKKSAAPVPVSQMEVLDDRHKLREYCRQNNLQFPDYAASDQFAKISLWAMKKNAFPMCIKTSKNLTNNKFFYILKAFRELPEFFENIQKENSNCEVLIEEFLEGKARLEVTVLNKKIRMISQICLNKTMKLQHKWRAFPITLPENIANKISVVIKCFNELIASTDEPLSFGFVVKNGEPVLLSINKNSNRIEFDEDWRKQAELEPLEEAVYPSKSKIINKLSIYRGFKEIPANLEKAFDVCSKTKVKWEISGSKLYVMLSSADTKAISEDCEKLDAMIKQLLGAMKSE